MVIRRLGHIDALRGLAALYVVMSHVSLTLYYLHGDRISGWAPYSVFSSAFQFGRAPVDLFLCISGFVLYHPIASGARGAEPYGRFMLRRAWRIVPPYYASLAVSIAVIVGIAALAPGGVVTAPASTSVLSLGIRNVIAHLLLLHNLTDPADVYSINGALWSIPLEFQLYACFPLLHRAARRWGVEAMVAFGVVATLACRLVLLRLPGNYPLLVNSVPGFLSVFALGMLAAHAHVGGWALGRGRCLALASLVLWIVGGRLMLTHGFPTLGDTMWGAASALLLLATREGPAWLQSRGLLGLGRFSYSTYLIHAPLLGASCLALSLVVPQPALQFAWLLALVVPGLIAATYGFHRLFEIPFLTPPPATWMARVSPHRQSR